MKWQHIQYENGSNPYICKTESEFNRLKRKYGKRLEPLKEGFWNWLIEIITYCDKDKLNELEKYYIEFFKCQEFGYNKTGGG